MKNQEVEKVLTRRYLSAIVKKSAKECEVAYVSNVECFFENGLSRQVRVFLKERMRCILARNAEFVRVLNVFLEEDYSCDLRLRVVKHFSLYNEFYEDEIANCVQILSKSPNLRFYGISLAKKIDMNLKARGVKDEVANAFVFVLRDDNVGSF